MSDEMIISRLRTVCGDLAMSDTEFANNYHIELEQVPSAKIFKSIAMLEVIADELQEYLDKEQAKAAAAAAGREVPSVG